eukprot:scaffold37865_cov151-Skeletonema_marinoi.AAC.1
MLSSSSSDLLFLALAARLGHSDRSSSSDDDESGSRNESSDSSSGDGDSSVSIGSVENDDEDEYEQVFIESMQNVKDNEDVRDLCAEGSYGYIQNMTNEDWEQLGRDISNHDHLGSLSITRHALEDENMSFLFRGLTKSNTIKYVTLYENDFGAEGVLAMVPFLQNVDYLEELNLNDNTITSEGFNSVFRALHGSAINYLRCSGCGIDSIKIDNDYIPRNLRILGLCHNSINADGCRELAKLLQRSLLSLELSKNCIDDEGVEILANSLCNSSLLQIDLTQNQISVEGMKLLLKVVNDISSIESTLRSNHTLNLIKVVANDDAGGGGDKESEEVQQQINDTVMINRRNRNNPEAAGKEKVIHSQLNSIKRRNFAALLGVDGEVLYSEINCLHLPEVLSIIGETHGQGELYVALRSSIAALFSTVDRKQCLQQQRAYHRAKLEAIEAEITAIEGAQENAEVSRGTKRTRRDVCSNSW